MNLLRHCDARNTRDLERLVGRDARTLRQRDMAMTGRAETNHPVRASHLFVDARLEVQHACTADRHDVIVPREPMGTVPVGLGHTARRLAIAISQHFVLREDLDVLHAATGPGNENGLFGDWEQEWAIWRLRSGRYVPAAQVGRGGCKRAEGVGVRFPVVYGSVWQCMAVHGSVLKT